MMPIFTDMAAVVPPGKIGTAEIVHDVPDKFTIMMGNLHGMPLEERTYTRLIVGGRLYMTDADFERRTNVYAVIKAEGDVLIAGLGIGLILKPILDRKEVRSVTVVEKSADVIALVGPRFDSRKLTLVNADIFKWKPTKGQKFDCIYFDIWADVCTDNLDEIATLHRRFSRCLKGKRWMNSWCREQLLNDRRRGR